jgi:deoxycytidylate deaminase
MALASSLSLQSSCIKRRVGAVLCNKRGFIVSAAYNEIPGKKEESCLSLYRMCYRDHYRDKFKREILKKFQHCPLCTEKLTGSGLDISCPKCKKDLVDLFPSDFKALDKCRSLHAEEAVLLQTPSSESEEAILYVTTFPCMQCAKRIVHSKVAGLFYIDPYPNSESVEILKKGGVAAEKFEGIKAQVFYRLYYRQRERIEKEIEKRLERRRENGDMS